MPVKAGFQPCPRCGSHVHRVHRGLLDRLISIVVPMYRYRCSKCRWSGLRRPS